MKLCDGFQPALIIVARWPFDHFILMHLSMYHLCLTLCDCWNLWPYIVTALYILLWLEIPYWYCDCVSKSHSDLPLYIEGILESNVIIPHSMGCSLCLSFVVVHCYLILPLATLPFCLYSQAGVGIVVVYIWLISGLYSAIVRCLSCWSAILFLLVIYPDAVIVGG